MIFKQKKWKILITLTVPSCPEVAPKWSPKVTKWSVYGQSKVPTWFSFLPGFDILPQRKHFWLGRCFLWSLAYCLVFGRCYRIFWALWVFKKKCFLFCGWISVIQVVFQFCELTTWVVFDTLLLFLPGRAIQTLHSFALCTAFPESSMIRGFLALQIHFERITELWKLLFFTILILKA